MPHNPRGIGGAFHPYGIMTPKAFHWTGRAGADIGLFTEPSTLRRTTLSGVTEILLIVAIVVAVFLLPRMMAKNPDKDIKPSNSGFSISGRMRLAIVLSFLWPALVALFLKPWNNHWVAFLYVALGPVALSWGIWWIWWGFRKERRRW